ncbi:MAG TPA: hypothetical protein VMO26_07015 [Vicinamibacterales bacterium]|nr:hypothetical protein [Vicinamibacterales bacterium]
MSPRLWLLETAQDPRKPFTTVKGQAHLQSPLLKGAFDHVRPLAVLNAENRQFLPGIRTAPEAAALPPGFADSDVAFGCQFVEVTTRFHPFVQHADDLDHAFPGDAIVENVNRSPNLYAFSRTACVSDVEAADTRTKVRSLPCEQPVGLSRDLPHRGGENSGVPLPTLGAPTLGTCRKDVGKIDLRGASEAKPRHSP